jgi:cation diffusion facilitator CzcD-associated flavoprotein CzcO
LTDLDNQSKHSKDFEGVVVATGFFSKPILPEGIDDEDRASTLGKNAKHMN